MRRFSTEWAVVNCVEVSACASKRTQQLNPLWRISSGKFLGRTYIADGVYDGYIEDRTIDSPEYSARKQVGTTMGICEVVLYDIVCPD